MTTCSSFRCVDYSDRCRSNAALSKQLGNISGIIWDLSANHVEALCKRHFETTEKKLGFLNSYLKIFKIPSLNSWKIWVFLNLALDKFKISITDKVSNLLHWKCFAISHASSLLSQFSRQDLVLWNSIQHVRRLLLGFGWEKYVQNVEKL